MGRFCVNDGFCFWTWTDYEKFPGLNKNRDGALRLCFCHAIYKLSNRITFTIFVFEQSDQPFDGYNICDTSCNQDSPKYGHKV